MEPQELKELQVYKELEDMLVPKEQLVFKDLKVLQVFKEDKVKQVQQVPKETQDLKDLLVKTEHEV